MPETSPMKDARRRKAIEKVGRDAYGLAVSKGASFAEAEKAGQEAMKERVEWYKELDAASARGEEAKPERVLPQPAPEEAPPAPPQEDTPQEDTPQIASSSGPPPEEEDEEGFVTLSQWMDHHSHPLNGSAWLSGGVLVVRETFGPIGAPEAVWRLYTATGKGAPMRLNRDMLEWSVAILRGKPAEEVLGLAFT